MVLRGIGGAWFGAGDGPAARRIFGEFAHFCAAGRSLRRRATTVAALDFGLANSGRRVSPNGERQERGGEPKIQSEPDGNAANAEE